MISVLGLVCVRVCCPKNRRGVFIVRETETKHQHHLCTNKVRAAIFLPPSFLILSHVYYLGWWNLADIFSRLHPMSYKHSISRVEPGFCLLLHSHFITVEPCGILKGCLVCFAYFYLIPGKMLWFTVFWENKKVTQGSVVMQMDSPGDRSVCVCTCPKINRGRTMDAWLTAFFLKAKYISFPTQMRCWNLLKLQICPKQHVSAHSLPCI